jgi:formylglycine-generating enzyme required for sulfatase activity
MNMKKTILCVVATTSAMLMASDTPEVSNVVMEQASFGRQVTITYELSNAPNGAVVTLDVETNATGGAWASIGGKAVCNARGAVWRKVTSADADSSGKYTITWRPDLSWEGHKVELANGGARAVVTAWALDNTPNYMVVDISATGGADKQTYYPTADFVPGGVANCLYKTTTLLMRKIMAKDVTWTMGSVAESGRNAAETTHQVTLTSNYYIGVYEVTQTQWQQITGYNPSKFTADQAMRPVENVSYEDIRQGQGTVSTSASAMGGVYPAAPYGNSFLGLLRTKTGIDFDMPSDAQWEFAARAGNGEGYWGDGSSIRISSDMDAALNRMGRYLNNPSSNSATTPDYATIAPSEGGTAIVGSYEPNDWGLYDMHGNTYEWCLDWHKTDITDLNGAVNTKPGSYYVIRGGSWRHTAGNCRSARRYDNRDRLSYVGFRVICTVGLAH